MIVRLTEEAERDLETIGDFIARDDPRRAVTFIGELRASCLDLAEFAMRFPLVERYAASGIRHRVHGNYLIFYQVLGDTVVVLHVVHGARDYQAILNP